ncbi:ABC transporter ATP-binding protein [Paraburkholderia silvatlantica]|uniref:ABC transporter, ATP-binding protein n=2 Tax=cellular organisms TaxID=131567 RepID=W2TMH1_NECAM|nr:ABC transporter ATP-binding protein [Paraburkholderia silvatlantica]XP_013305517.1 ABC transporter, ATP-binding protein [Necator americanus]ETN83290.1 ABC transporter, ATP-binding protein [Necator americanus]MBB2927968.1 ABC-type nitrate/sulfonate/bicarbonate transport system ATPase subunit [Paraburkholderia silvatlantica]PVY27470.1 NitT/TauT family transport system ATP-binding protein [Paraburkholderia silvatlantica]PXW34443.1 NitT/TauT family transport system ATP-binding protein [Paraburk
MTALARNAHAFRVEQLTVPYQGAKPFPIECLSLDLREGEITCILGKSGCGKTTLLKALGGFVQSAKDGGVLFRGRYINGPTSDIVMIFQDNNLFPWLTVRQNVAFGLKFRPSPPEGRGFAVDRMLENVGLAEAARVYPHQLSGGMRQRAAIARALVADPKVLLLDEPFSALDIGLRRRMHVLMRALWERSHKTMVMVTHSIEEAILIGHRVIVLGGRPARVLFDADTSAPEMKDRYSADFLDLQKLLEALID